MPPETKQILLDNEEAMESLKVLKKSIKKSNLIGL